MQLITDPDIIAGYLGDASNTFGQADALARPRDAAQVAEILRAATDAGVGVTVTACRTSTTAAPVPRGGWLLSTENLVDGPGPGWFGAGVILGALQADLLRQGRYFPPDPTSRDDCSLGGAIACNASGARSFRYGPIRRWITGVQVVLPTGEIVHATRDTPLPTGWTAPAWTEPNVKTAAGYSPTTNLLDLIIGSEGTLGVITAAQLRTLPPPAGVMSLIAFFPDLPSTLAFVNTARAGAQRPDQAAVADALNPAAIEYFDHQALAMVRARVPDIPDDAHAALFIEVEHSGDAPMERWWDALVDGGAMADHTILAEDDVGRARLQAVRHAIPAGVNEQVAANGMPKVGTDFAVPDDALADMMALYAAVPLPQICFGHIGDNHLHLNLLPGSPDALREARAHYVRLARAALARGGTVSAEHGIGKLKRALLAEMVGPETLAAFHALKRAADPHLILGRGTLLAPTENP